MWSFGVHTNNIWRGNLSFIQGFDNLLDLICGSVLQASRSTMTWSVNRQFTMYTCHLYGKFGKATGSFTANEYWSRRRSSNLCSDWASSSTKHLKFTTSSMTRSWLKLRLILAADKNESPEVGDRTSMLLQTTCSTKLRQGFFRFVLGWSLEARADLESGSTVGLEEERGHFQLGQNIQRPSTSPCLIPFCFFPKDPLIPFWTRTTTSILIVAGSQEITPGGITSRLPIQEQKPNSYGDLNREQQNPKH